MNDPTVACILLTRDRPDFARRAVECFRSQTYVNKRLLIVNSGVGPILSEAENGVGGIEEPCFVGIDARTIGALRNLGAKYASAHYIESWTRPEIFLHFDDDDHSHPNRIAEQVALLQASGAECVGYRECLFWRACGFCDAGTHNILPECPKCHLKYDPARKTPVGEAWLYSVPNSAWAIGSSFCYWRSTWERHPFPDLPAPGVVGGSSEDVVWRRGVKCVGVSGFNHATITGALMPDANPSDYGPDLVEPRMVCRIHGGNSQAYDLDAYAAKNEAHPTWRRAPEWDEYCRKVCG